LQLATRHDFSESHPLAIRSGISQFQIGERSPFSFAQCRFDFGNKHLSLGGQTLGNRLDYYSEYIDLNRLDDEKYQSALRNYLRARYFDDAVDLVIASGPSVVDFLNRDPSLLRNVPLVFTSRPGTSRGPHATGIVSVIDL